MKWFKVLVFIAIALFLNYSSGWTYEKGKEERTPRNDSVIVRASDRYSRLNFLKWVFLGRNYRREWTQPVKMPLFHLNTTKGGFTIERLGGGQQTKSLHLVDKDSSRWILRMVDKDVTEALVPRIRHTFIQSIVQDQISAAYPYEALTIGDLSSAAGIPAPTAELYYIGDDTALGQYRPIFANSVCMLMSKLLNGQNIETYSTDTIASLLSRDNYYQVMQEKVLMVRLFDMLIADWDRHKLQWKWAREDSLQTGYFYPVPEDRDQAYFLSQGALSFLVRIFGMPHLVGFKKTPGNLINLNYKTHSFDRYYMNDLDRKDWERLIRTFQLQMTDSVIHYAIGKLPAEVYAISGKVIEDKLKSRRDLLYDAALKYYDYLSTDVAIDGSAMPEVFRILKTKERITVALFRSKDGKQVYSRTFYPKETRSISINNLGREDVIHVEGAEKNTIKMSFLYREN